MAVGGFWDDQQAAVKVSQRASEVKERLNSYQTVVSAVDDMRQLWELLKDEGATDGSDDYTELVSEIKATAVAVDRLEIELLLDGEYDGQPALLTINAGAGGVDSCDWAEMLYRMYMMWFSKQQLKGKITSEVRDDVAGIQNITLRVEGKNAFGLLRVEAGVHRLVRISPFDKNNRRHTSFAAVDVIPEIDETTEVLVADDDIKMDVFRASGAGGQHVNKTNSAVRLTHLPTGIIASCQNERSQLRNREVALVQLKSKLVALMQAEHKEKIEDIRGSHSEIAWGNQIRSYVLHPYQLVKDVRTGQETGSAQKVLDGELTPFIWAGLRWMRETRNNGGA